MGIACLENCEHLRLWIEGTVCVAGWQEIKLEGGMGKAVQMSNTESVEERNFYELKHRSRD